MSLLASSASKQSAWSRELAKKVLLCLGGTAEQGLTMTADGSEDLIVYSDAGFAGADTRSQNGLVIIWAGSIITWSQIEFMIDNKAALTAASLGPT